MKLLKPENSSIRSPIYRMPIKLKQQNKTHTIYKSYTKRDEADMKLMNQIQHQALNIHQELRNTLIRSSPPLLI